MFLAIKGENFNGNDFVLKALELGASIIIVDEVKFDANEVKESGTIIKVENTRKEISENSLGIPVIAMGIPTVVESAVLVNDCLDLFIGKLQDEAQSNEYLNKLKEQDNYEEIKSALIPNEYNMIVTPKEIDELIDNMSSIVARGINMSV